MKIRILYGLFLLALCAVLFWNASGGPAAVQGSDRTRSPLSENSSCSTCHNAGAFSTGLSVQMLAGGTAVTSYEPGKTYQLRVAVTGADAAAEYGFQAVLLYGDNNMNAGTFGTAPAGMQVTSLNNRIYAEHSQPSSNNVFTINWTAPESGVGNIRIYAAVNAANGNNSVTGDQGAFLTEPVVLAETPTSNTNDRRLRFDAITLAPNPTREGLWLTLDNDRPGNYQLTLLNAVGQNLQKRTLDLPQGRQSHWIDLGQLPAGLYLLQLSDGRRQLTRKVVKE